MTRDVPTRVVAHLFCSALAVACLITFACMAKAAAQPVPQTVPLPPPRPAELTPAAAQKTAPAPEPAVAKPEPAPPQPTPDDNEGLRAQILASRHIVGEPLPAVADAGGCGIAAPLRVEAVILADGHQVHLSPPAVMRASLASVLADWLRDDLGQAVADKDDRLAAIEGVGGYECRTRDRLHGAAISQHGFGNALDLEAFVTARGKRFVVGALSEADRSQPFMTVAMSTACLRFATVLGPGADSFHTLHMHVDLAARRSGTRLCQWSVQTIAADHSPRARP